MMIYTPEELTPQCPGGPGCRRDCGLPDDAHDPYHGDGVPNAVLHDLRAIMAALGIDDYARPYSPHEVVQREVLPAIERLRSAPPGERL